MGYWSWCRGTARSQLCARAPSEGSGSSFAELCSVYTHTLVVLCRRMVVLLFSHETVAATPRRPLQARSVPAFLPRADCYCGKGLHLFS